MHKLSKACILYICGVLIFLPLRFLQTENHFCLYPGEHLPSSFIDIICSLSIIFMATLCWIMLSLILPSSSSSFFCVHRYLFNQNGILSEFQFSTDKFIRYVAQIEAFYSFDSNNINHYVSLPKKKKYEELLRVSVLN